MAATDTELVHMARSGDHAAFEQLVRRHDSRVFAIAASYVSNSEDAKDIFQEVFLRVYRALPGFRFQSEFTTWLHRITVNVCLSHRRKFARTVWLQVSGSDEEGNNPVTEAVADTDSPEQRSMDDEISRHVETALQTLSPRQRMVFTLRHFQGHKLEEIARMMGCSQGTVKRYLFTATRRLRGQLHDLL